MKRLVTLVLIVITVVIGSSCNRTEELKIPDDMYSVLYTLRSGDTGFLLPNYVYERMYLQGSISRYKHSLDKKGHTFASNQLEIEYEKPQGYDTVRNEPINIRYQIGVKEISHQEKAYIILWRNSITKQSGATVASSWGIGEDTYYVKTNLPREFISKLYPNFTGEYYHISPHRILVNDSLTVDSKEFYEGILTE